MKPLLTTPKTLSAVYESEGKVVRTQIEKNSTQYYVIDHERANNSIRTLISINYSDESGELNTEEQTSIEEVSIDNGYQLTQESAQEQIETVTTDSTAISIKNIEFAKQISGTQNNVIGIITYELGDAIMKVSIQNKTEQNASQNGLTNNTIIYINNSDTTYFSITTNSNISPSSSVSVQELNDTNSVLLNNLTSENISQLVNAIAAQLQKIYEQQMQVVKQMQEQEDAQNASTQINQNVEQSNTITDTTNVVQ